MASPQISFRLTAYQLARGLKILRTIEPDHVPASLSQLVKTLYIDYMAKTSLKKGDVVSEADIAEIYNLINNKAKSMSFGAFQEATSATEDPLATLTAVEPVIEPTQEEIDNDESEINSLSDFRPPADWNL